MEVEPGRSSASGGRGNSGAERAILVGVDLGSRSRSSRAGLAGARAALRLNGSAAESEGLDKIFLAGLRVDAIRGLVISRDPRAAAAIRPATGARSSVNSRSSLAVATAASRARTVASATRLAWVRWSKVCSVMVRSRTSWAPRLRSVSANTRLARACSRFAT